MPKSSFTCRRSRGGRISSIGKAAGSRSSAASRSPARRICSVCSSPDQNDSGRSVPNSLAMTGLDGRRFEPNRHGLGEVVVAARVLHAVGALLERDELGAEAVVAADDDREIRERAHEKRVARAQEVVRTFADGSDPDDERRCGSTTVRLRCNRVDDVQHDLGVGAGRVWRVMYPCVANSLATPSANHVLIRGQRTFR